MNIPNGSCDDNGAETITNVDLPNEILLHIFRFLEFEDLIDAEQVCCQWKKIVETCFATEKRLDLLFEPDDYIYALNWMKRYGSSIKTLTFGFEFDCDKFKGVEEIADRFPNLLKMELWSIRITDDEFKYLSTKCCQLTNVTLHDCNFTAEGLRIFLQALPGIEVLSINTIFRHTDASVVFSNCRSLHTLKLNGAIICTDTACFSNFCKECVTLRRLVIYWADLPKEMFVQIQHCSLLEELKLVGCGDVEDSTLELISKGCPNLRSVTFFDLQLVIDKGLKCFARCRNLNSFVTNIKQLTDETLVELSKCVNLREVKLSWCPLVSDRGCAALLAHCPRLELMDVEGCKGVSNATVDSAIKAVESRQNGLVLQLILRGQEKCFLPEMKTSNLVTMIAPRTYENCHPLLRVSYKC